VDEEKAEDDGESEEDEDDREACRQHTVPKK